jgi:tetratricopeptide (TPR) repeat protein
VAIRQTAFGRLHPLVASSLTNQAIAQWAQGDLDGAIAVYREALAIQISAFGPEDRVVAYTFEGIGLAQSDQGDQQAALESLQRAVDILTKAVGPDHRDTADAYANLAEPLLKLGRWDEAIADATRRLQVDERANGPDYPGLSQSLVLVGRGLEGKHQYVQALEVLERALHLADTPGYTARKLAHVRLQLAHALRESRTDAARAVDLAALARAELTKEGAKLELARLDEEFPASP